MIFKLCKHAVELSVSQLHAVKRELSFGNFLGNTNRSCGAFEK